MSLSLFNHQTLSHYSEVAPTSDQFGHSFGGRPGSFGIRFVDTDRTPHLLYRLNLADPAVGVVLPGVKWLPLCYGFSYAAFDGEFVYRVISDSEVELILPAEATFDPDFPYANYPREFPQSAVAFARQPYDPTVAEDALKLAAIFGVDRLSDSEMQRAIKIVEETSTLFSDWSESPMADDPDWTPEALVRHVYKEPFAQGAPTKSCGNPACTAEIKYHREEMIITDDDPDLEIRLPAQDVRVDTMRVFALHRPGSNESFLWGDSHVQLVFEICDVCRCIRVSNQCG